MANISNCLHRSISGGFAGRQFRFAAAAKPAAAGGVFGNMVSGTSSFPSIKSGDNGGTGVTMENNGLSPQTNCEDNKDTAGYWAPEPYFNHVAWLGAERRRLLQQLQHH